MKRRSLEHTLSKRVIAPAIAARREVVPARVLGRNTDGVNSVQPLDGECPQRADGIDGHGVGDVVTSTVPAANQRGVAGLGSSLSIGSSLVHLEKQDPSFLVRGQTQTVTFTGSGFRAGLFLEYLLSEEEESNPDITVANLTVEGPTSATAEVTVAETARLLDDRSAPIRYGVS